MKTLITAIIAAYMALFTGNPALAQEPKFTISSMSPAAVPYEQCVYHAYNTSPYPGVVISKPATIFVDNERQITITEYQAYKDNLGQIGKFRVICIGDAGEYISNEIEV